MRTPCSEGRRAGWKNRARSELLPHTHTHTHAHTRARARAHTLAPWACYATPFLCYAPSVHPDVEDRRDRAQGRQVRGYATQGSNPRLADPRQHCGSPTRSSLVSCLGQRRTRSSPSRAYAAPSQTAATSRRGPSAPFTQRWRMLLTRSTLGHPSSSAPRRFTTLTACLR